MTFVELTPPRGVVHGSLARRLDRLSRAAHSFHRFAHHPLCDRYGGEVFRIGGRTRVCRGCTLALLGAMSGSIVGAAFGSALEAWIGLVLACGLGALSLRGGTGSLAPPARPSKLVTRLVPAFGLALAVASAARHPTAWSVACGACAGLSSLLLFALYRRRGPDRSACSSCPERVLAKTCSGFRPIVLRERAVMRRAGALIARLPR